jgi:hypothetical protein
VGEIISESVGGIIPERRAASPGIGTFGPSRGPSTEFASSQILTSAAVAPNFCFESRRRLVSAAGDGECAARGSLSKGERPLCFRRKELAIEAATFLKNKDVHSEVTLRDLKTDKTTTVKHPLQNGGGTAVHMYG